MWSVALITVFLFFFLPSLFSSYNGKDLFDYLDRGKLAEVPEICLNAEGKESINQDINSVWGVGFWGAFFGVFVFLIVVAAVVFVGWGWGKDWFVCFKT